MKKFIAWILMLCMVMGLLCGCGGTTSSSRDRKQKKDKEDQEQKQTVTIEESVVYDANDIKVTVTGLKEGYAGLEVKILVENDTDRNIALSGDLFVVNGITMSGWLYAEAAAGKKTNDVITLYSSDLEGAGIESLATLECVDAHIVDTDSYDRLFDAPFRVETSIAGDYQQEIDLNGDVIFEEAGVTVIAKTISDGIMGQCVVLLVKNETGKNITVEAENVSVNGFTIDSWMYDTVVADTVRFCTLDLMSSSLEENGIEDVEEVTFSLAIQDADSWEAICESGELTVSAD